MTVLFVLFVIVWGAARGFGEGIVWFQRAPQFHPWQGLYHGVRLCEYGLLFGAGAVTEGRGAGRRTDMRMFWEYTRLTAQAWFSRFTS